MEHNFIDQVLCDHLISDKYHWYGVDSFTACCVDLICNRYFTFKNRVSFYHNVICVLLISVIYIFLYYVLGHTHTPLGTLILISVLRFGLQSALT